MLAWDYWVPTCVTVMQMPTNSNYIQIGRILSSWWCLRPQSIKSTALSVTFYGQPDNYSIWQPKQQTHLPTDWTTDKIYMLTDKNVHKIIYLFFNLIISPGRQSLYRGRGGSTRFCSSKARKRRKGRKSRGWGKTKKIMIGKKEKKNRGPWAKMGKMQRSKK